MRMSSFLRDELVHIKLYSICLFYSPPQSICIFRKRIPRLARFKKDRTSHALKKRTLQKCRLGLLVFQFQIHSIFEQHLTLHIKTTEQTTPLNTPDGTLRNHMECLVTSLPFGILYLKFQIESVTVN